MQFEKGQENYQGIISMFILLILDLKIKAPRM